MQVVGSAEYLGRQLFDPHLIRKVSIVLLIAAGLGVAYEPGGFPWFVAGVLVLVPAVIGSRRAARARTAATRHGEAR